MEKDRLTPILYGFFNMLGYLMIYYNYGRLCVLRARYNVTAPGVSEIIELGVTPDKAIGYSAVPLLVILLLNFAVIYSYNGGGKITRHLKNKGQVSTALFLSNLGLGYVGLFLIPSAYHLGTIPLVFIFSGLTGMSYYVKLDHEEFKSMINDYQGHEIGVIHGIEAQKLTLLASAALAVVITGVLSSVTSGQWDLAGITFQTEQLKDFAVFTLYCVAYFHFGVLRYVNRSLHALRENVFKHH
jgi:hypothetical protein